MVITDQVRWTSSDMTGCQLPSKASQAKPTPMAMSVKAMGNPSMISPTNRRSMNTPSCGSVMALLPIGMLFENDLLEFFDIVQPLRPGAGPEADKTADHFDHALQQQQYAGYRNECLVMIDRRPVGTVSRVLMTEP